jgi:hypothetical protein
MKMSSRKALSSRNMLRHWNLVQAEGLLLCPRASLSIRRNYFFRTVPPEESVYSLCEGRREMGRCSGFLYFAAVLLKFQQTSGTHICGKQLCRQGP